MKKISSIFKLIDYLSSKQKKEEDKYKSSFFFRIKGGGVRSKGHIYYSRCQIKGIEDKKSLPHG